MPRAIDFHVHLPTTEFMQVTLGPYAKAAERFFRTEVKLKDIEQIAADYAELDMIGVLLAWDAETATGLPPLGNDYIAAIVQRYPQQFIGFAIIGAHPSWPWHEEMIATMQHKTNVFNDLSGWVPKRIPETLLREAATRLQDRILFGSDYPFITPERWMKDFDALNSLKPEVREKIFWRNAQHLLAHTSVKHMHFS